MTDAQQGPPRRHQPVKTCGLTCRRVRVGFRSDSLLRCARRGEDTVRRVEPATTSSGAAHLLFLNSVSYPWKP